KALQEAPGGYDRAFWSMAAEMGWPAAPIAEEHGGLGLGLMESLIIAEACGGALAGAPFLACGWAVAHMLQQAPGAAGDALLPRLASGEAIAALAFTEGADALPRAPAV